MRRPDQSMDLLRTLTEEALEPEYSTTKAPRRTGWVTFLAVTLVAGLLTYAVVQTLNQRDAQESDRDQLLSQVEEARAYQEELSAELARTEREVAELSADFLPDDDRREALATVELLSGAVAVEGPGVIAVADDAPDATTAQGRVLDSDLSYLVNGFFEAGAEAIAINGRRVTALTPIRHAGAAITVDYVSLSPPYTVEVIGNPDQLAGRFATTRGAGWWQYLRLNYGLTLDVRTSDEDLVLAADPGMGLRHAEGG